MKYRVCIERPFMNCEKIYPLQQKYVLSIVESLQEDENVDRIIVFGSSVTSRCHIDSDIDIYVELKVNKRVNFPLINKEYDYWNNFTVDQYLKNEIMSKGVEVYVRE